LIHRPAIRSRIAPESVVEKEQIRPLPVDLDARPFNVPDDVMVYDHLLGAVVQVDAHGLVRVEVFVSRFAVIDPIVVNAGEIVGVTTKVNRTTVVVDETGIVQVVVADVAIIDTAAADQIASAIEDVISRQVMIRTTHFYRCRVTSKVVEISNVVVGDQIVRAANRDPAGSTPLDVILTDRIIHRTTI